MRHYTHYGFEQFVVALGYKGEVIKQYMENEAHLTHLTPDCTVELIDTGLHTMTGGRIKRLAPYLENETFMLTWADGLSDVNLHELLAFHRSHGKLATLTAVHPPAKFGYLALEGDRVLTFSEKRQLEETWINGAYFVLEPGIFDYIDGDHTQWEKGSLPRLAEEGQLMAYCHTSFWRCMDTLHEKETLEELWRTGDAPWQSWME